MNIFIGPNAQGKTNLLEAIYVLALSKSHRTHKDKEMIQWEKEGARIYGDVERRYGTVSLDLSLQSQGKKAKINGLEQRKLSEYVGTLNVVIFAPEDLDLVKGSPGIRRRFLDMEIGQVYPSYIHHLYQFQKTVHQRNQLLKQWQGQSVQNEALWDIWNQQLAEYGTKIMQRRQNFIQRLQFWVKEIHGNITAKKENLTIHYVPSFDFDDFSDETVLFEQFMLKLSHVKAQEIKRGMTLIGPHRDDIAFFINDQDVQTYGSQGQQRTAALSLKLAELELIHDEIGEYPLLLLDDVLSELDHHRQTQLLETFQKKVQTFITTTGTEGLNFDVLQDVHFYHVKDGTVQKKGV